MKYILLRIKSENYVKINLSDIIYIKGDGDYCQIYLKDKRFVYHFSLGKFEELLSNYGFFRCHRSFIVNLDKIERIDNNILRCENNIDIYFSESNKKELLTKLNFI